MSILFLAKHKPFADDAAALVKAHIPDSEIVFGNVGEPFPEYLTVKPFDYVVSYISPWIVPAVVLNNAKVAAINLHPGPPGYPGTGCTNFALYNNEKIFGITVHHMREKVDSGNIIMVERFPVFHDDTVYALSQRCYAHIYIAFVKVFQYIIENKLLPQSEEHWTRKPYMRKELNELCRVSGDMSEEEIKRRIRATTYPGMPGAFIELAGERFLFNAKTDGSK